MAPKKKTVTSRRISVKRADKKKGPNISSKFQYSEHQMNCAIEEIRRNNISVRDAAKKFNVPKSTLNDKARGSTPVPRRMGPKTFMNSTMENRIVQCLFTLADAGFPITKQQLLDNVADLMSKEEVNPFIGGRPGRKWFKLFRSRHPTVSMRVAQNISRSRAGVTEQNLRKWFDDVRKYCQSSSCTDALNDPKRIYNLDETAFFLAPEVDKVMAKKGSRTVYNIVKNSDRQCTTVLMGGNAAGQLAPSMVLFKNKIFPKNVSNHWPDNWGIGELNCIDVCRLCSDFLILQSKRH